MEYHEAWLENLIETFSAKENSGSSNALHNKSKRLVIRNSDLIFAERNELRMLSLADLKGGSRDSTASIKTLHTPNIAFEIQALILNHTKKLLAVVGTHQVVVIVLPRPGYSKLVTPMIECRSIQVGQYYHAARGSSDIAKVDWHPWSHSAASLLVLTCDANLREYDVSVDSEDPQQSVSFVQPSTMPGSVSTSQSSKSRGFSADDERSEECVSFDIGKCDSDWSALTLYGLMKNGDVYAVCPFIPNQAQVPISYIQNLRGLTEAKLLDPVHEDNGLVEARLNQQMRWLNAMAKQIQIVDDNATSFKCNPPRATGSILRQGPYLVQPPPSEEEYEVNASDIITFRPKELPMDVLVLVSTDGRVDVCLGAEKAEGRWSSKAEMSAPPPIISTYESIQLPDVDVIGYPSLSRDPVYEDTIYISHSMGVYALVLEPWLDEVSHSDSITKDSKVVQVIKTGSTSNTQANPIVALDVINDAYLGYVLFALTSNMQLLPLDLSLRVQEEPVSSRENTLASNKQTNGAPSKEADQTDEQNKLYSSLLDNPFKESSENSQINLTIKLEPANTKGELEITPKTLRYMGGVVENVRKYNQTFIETGNSIQNRLNLQIKETERQIDKLAHVARIATNPSNEAGVGTGKGARVESVSNEQNELLKRMDRLLQRLMDKHQPTLSTHEKKWFAELGRIRDEVSGSDGKGRALQARMSRLSHQLEMLRPQVEAYQASQAVKNSQSAAIGASQIAKVEGVLHEETNAIEDLRLKLDKVTALLKSD